MLSPKSIKREAKQSNSNCNSINNSKKLQEELTNNLQMCDSSSSEDN